MASKDMILVEVNAQQNAEIVAKYNVQGTPDVRIYSPKGKMLGRIVGFSWHGLLAAIDKAHIVDKRDAKTRRVYRYKW